ncbi:MAG TPA: hypothetical protein DCE56_23010 [Cyanobacteria bacterium UBA8553]|nr:hypothetical protein [Cyanobacteria bacterium UBA8553]
MNVEKLKKPLKKVAVKSQKSSVRREVFSGVVAAIGLRKMREIDFDRSSISVMPYSRSIHKLFTFQN